MRSAPSALKITLAVLLLVSACITVAGKIHGLGDFGITVWGDRDLWRGLSFGPQDSFLGPETNSGMRMPGGFFYILLAGVFHFAPSAMGANGAMVGFFALSMIVLGAAVWRVQGGLAAAAAMALLAGSGSLKASMGVWNPGFIPFFAAVFTACALLFLHRPRAVWLFAGTLALSLGMQIHQQILLLVPGFLLALAAARIRPSGGMLLAALAGLLVPMLPFAGLILDLPQVLSNGVSTYAGPRLQLQDKLMQVFNTLGGAYAGLGGLLNGRVPGAGALLLMADGAAALLFLAAVPLLAPAVLRARDPRANAAAGLCIMGATYLLLTMLSHTNFRHMAASVPALSAAAGMAAALLLERFRRSRALTGLVVLALGLVAGRAAVMGAVGFTSTGFRPDTAAAQTELSRSLKAAAFETYEAVENRASLFAFRNGGLQFEAADISNRFHFIFATTAQPASERVADGCVAAVAKPGFGDISSGTLAAQLGAHPAMAVLAPRFRDGWESANFWYLPYDGTDGNCLKSFSNPYIANQFEERFLHPGQQAAQAVLFQGSAVFTLPQPGSLFPLGVVIEPAGEGLTAVVQGRLQRGHTGLNIRQLTGLRLCLTGVGEPKTVAFAPVAIGNEQVGALTPWASPRFSVPEGSYTIWIVGKDNAGPFSQPLGGLELAGGRPLKATPAAKDSEAPAACR